MDPNEHHTESTSKVIAFDTLFCTNHIQMLKVMLPYMDNQTQKSMAVYIKFLELNYTMEYFRRHPNCLCGCMEREQSPDLFKMCSELLPYCTEREKAQLEQIQNISRSMEMYKEMSQTMEMMKDFMPDAAAFMDSFAESGQEDHSPDEEENENQGTFGNFDMMSMLMNMLTPEQRQMYEMFGGNQHGE
ncbi:MAG: hypothetical protein HFI95_01660 [Lachnospiraceae bacterium]|nr:hypothetical protein [Lachnospiraceae bacterium]